MTLQENDLYIPSKEELSQENFSLFLSSLKADIYSWRSDAACWNKPKGYMYPSSSKQQAKRVEELCLKCDKQTQCLFYSLAAREEFGVWGGTTESTRKALFRSIKPLDKNWSEETRTGLYSLCEQLVFIHKGKNARIILQAQA